MTYLKGQDHDGLLVDDCTTAVEDRLSASLARDRLRSALKAVGEGGLAIEELQLLSWIFREYHVHLQYPAFVDRINSLRNACEQPSTSTVLDPADVQTLLDEVDDLNRRLRSATHAMQKALSAIDNEQYHARIRAARSYLDDELDGLVQEFGIEG